MWLKPTRADHMVIARYTGKITVGFGILEVPALLTALACREWNTALDFTIGILLCLAVGLGLQQMPASWQVMHRRQGLAVVGTSWLLVTVLGAVPLYLSGHYGSPVQATFDVMSGLTTTGLYLLQDLDHVANGLNMWRFILTFAGGQGIIVIALTFMFGGSGGSGALHQLYIGEGKDERLVPHVMHTARAIWTVSLGWLVVGTLALGLLLRSLGEPPARAGLHGLWMFMGSWSTGGFAPQSYNTIWFHSGLFEALTIVIFTAGSLNFALHWAVWRGSPRELWRNIETRSFVTTLSLLAFAGAWTLSRTGIYGSSVILFRKLFYQLVSAHTTTGFGTIPGRSFVTQWGDLGMTVIIAAMIFGGSACSTAGGIKALRIGLITKSFLHDIKRMVSPESMRSVVRYHHIRNQILADDTMRTVLTVTVLFFTMHAFVTVAGMVAGHPLSQALFEGVSAASNSGLSCGVLSPAFPDWLTLIYTVAMWMGRMEFFAVFALGGWVWAMVRGR